MAVTDAEFRTEVDIAMSDFFNYRVSTKFSIKPDIGTGLTDYFSVVRLSQDGTKIETNEGLSLPVAEVQTLYTSVMAGRLVNFTTPSIVDADGVAIQMHAAERVAAEIKVQTLSNGIVYSIGLAKLQIALGIDPDGSAEEEEEEAAA